VRLDKQPVLDGLRAELAVFFDDLIDDTRTGSVDGGSKKHLRFVAFVLDLDNATIRAAVACLHLAHPRVSNFQVANDFLMRWRWRGRCKSQRKSRCESRCQIFH
jgi:hypothetical protein